MADRHPRIPVGRLRNVVPLLAACLLAACSSIPTSGPVREGRDLQLDREDSAVRLIGQPPAPGASPEDVVRGFLQASADFVNDHAVAREYLAPGVRQRWDPGVGTTIYDRAEGPFEIRPTSDGLVVLTAEKAGSIDRDGRYQRAAPDTEMQRQFRMARVAGEWRIAGLDDGLLLTPGDVRDTYRQVSLYYLAPSRTVLVPDTVLLPALPGLSTKLVTRLLRGPTAPLRAAATTAFPQGTGLDVSSVPIRDGVAVVSLDDSALQANDDARTLMSVQLVWTLKQLPEVQAVRITAGGEDLGVSGVGEEQPRTAWPSYDPAGLSQDPNGYFVRDGRVGRLVDHSFDAVPGPAGDGRLALRSFAISLDAGRLAGVTPDGRSLVVGRIAEQDTPRAVLRGANLSPPSWDPAGNVWVVDRASGRVWLVPGGTEAAAPVALPRLAGGPAAGIRVAREGVRVALIVGGGDQARLWTGVVLRDESSGLPTRIEATREVLPELRGVRDVAWADATTLAVLGRMGAEPVSPLLTDADGYNLSPIEPRPGLVSITAAPPTRPMLAGTASGKLHEYTSGRGWNSLGDGAAPTYPG